MRKAYEFALNYVGQDKDSGEIWTDYIEFLRSGEVCYTLSSSTPQPCPCPRPFPPPFFPPSFCHYIEPTVHVLVLYTRIELFSSCDYPERERDRV